MAHNTAVLDDKVLLLLLVLENHAVRNVVGWAAVVDLVVG